MFILDFRTDRFKQIRARSRRSIGANPRGSKGLSIPDV